MQELIISAAGGHAFEWLDVTAPSVEELRELSATFGLHKTSVQDSLDPHHLPKYESFHNGSFLIIRSYDLDSRTAVYTIQGLTRKIAIFVLESTLVTIHRKEIPFLEDLKKHWRGKGQSEKLPSLHHALNEILQGAFATYQPALEQCQARLELLEMAVFEPETQPFDSHEAYHLIRTSSVVKRMLRMGLEAFQKLEAVPSISLPFFRDLEENTQSLLLWAADLVENGNRILQLQIAMASQTTNQASHRINETMRVLTILTVFFLPLNLISGIFGMNFEWMPAVHSPGGFWISLAAMAISTGLIFVWFLKKGWLKAPD